MTNTELRNLASGIIANASDEYIDKFVFVAKDIEKLSMEELISLRKEHIVKRKQTENAAQEVYQRLTDTIILLLAEENLDKFMQAALNTDGLSNEKLESLRKELIVIRDKTKEKYEQEKIQKLTDAILATASEENIDKLIQDALITDGLSNEELASLRKELITRRNQALEEQEKLGR